MGRSAAKQTKHTVKPTTGHGSLKKPKCEGGEKKAWKSAGTRVCGVIRISESELDIMNLLKIN